MILRKLPLILITCLGLMRVNAQGDEVNNVIGNESWEMLKNTPLSPGTSEQDRISTHLRYVISLLKNTNGELEHASKREYCIALLQEYLNAGVFPRHHKSFEDRRPCFIDSSGNICAVGYLVQQTAGREEAERINGLYQYAYLSDMKDESLLKWQRESGFSLRELAMIQPAYDFRPRRFGSYYDQKEMLYGIIDNYSQEKITPPIFTTVQQVGEQDLFLTQIGEKYGITNSKGDELVKHVFEKILPQSIGDEVLFLATAAGTLSVFTAQSNLLATITNGRLRQFNHSFMVIESDGGEGVLSHSGDWVVPLAKHKVQIETLIHHRLNNGLEQTLANRCIFLVENEQHKFGVIDSRGKQIVPFEYSSLKRQEFVWIAEKEGKKSLLLVEGTSTGIEDFTSLKGINGYPGSNVLIICKGERCGLIDRKGNWRIEQKYKHITQHLEFYHVYGDDGFACYTSAFHAFVPPHQKVMGRYRDVYYYYGKGKAAVKKLDGSYLIAPTEDSVAFVGFTPGNNAVFGKRQGNYWKFINDKGITYPVNRVEAFKSLSRENLTLTYGGKTYVGTLYQDKILIADDLPISEISLLGQGIYAIRQNGKYGTIQLYPDYEKGYKRYYPSTLDTIYPVKFQYNSLFMAAENGKMGMLDLFGKVVLGFEYDAFRSEYTNAPFTTGVYLRKEAVWYYYSQKTYSLTRVNDDMQALLEKSEAHHEVDSNLKKLRTIRK